MLAPVILSTISDICSASIKPAD